MTRETTGFGHGDQALATFSFLACRGAAAAKVSMSKEEEVRMSPPFAWFHHNGQKSKEAKGLYESMFAWKSSGGPAGMTMLATDAGPFAAIGSQEHRYGEREEWIPFVARGRM